MARVSAEQRRQDLTEAAFRVMARVGVSSATTRLIAEEAGVPQSVFHYCFRSKDELLQQLTKVVVEEMVGNALDAVVEAGSFDESLRRSLRRLWENGKQHPAHQLVLYELTTAALREPDGQTLASWQYEHYWESTGRFLEVLAERSGVTWTRPLAVLSRMVTTMIDGLILGWLADRDTEQAEAALDLFAEQLVSLARST
jgi:AcrR family transcriptional regulator